MALNRSGFPMRLKCNFVFAFNWFPAFAVRATYLANDSEDAELLTNQVQAKTSRDWLSSFPALSATYVFASS